MNISYSVNSLPEIELERFAGLRGIKALIYLDGEQAHALIANEPEKLAKFQNDASKVGQIAHALQNLHGPGLCSISTSDEVFITRSGGNLVIVGGTGMNLGMCSIALQQSGAWQPLHEPARNAFDGMLDVIARSVLPRWMSAEVEGVSHEYELRDGCLVDPAGTVMSLLEALRNGRPIHYSLAPLAPQQTAPEKCAFISALAKISGETAGDSWKIDASGWPHSADIGAKVDGLRDVLRIAHALKILVKNDDSVTVDYLCADRRRLRAASFIAQESISALHATRS